MNSNEADLDLAKLDISEYPRFAMYIERLREFEFPYAKFVTMVLHLPRRLAADFLRRATFHPSPEVICEALDLLSRLWAIDSCPRCLELLVYADPRVRQVAIESLHLMQIRCETSILRLLHTEVDGDVRHAAVRFLALVGTAQSLATLNDMKTRDHCVDYEGRPMADLIEKAIRDLESREALDEQA